MEQIGRYQLLNELGRGAMGQVWRALDPTIGREVAIKTIKLSDLGNSAEQKRLRDRLLREARSAGILSHPGVVTIYDAGEENNVAYVAMEFVTGPSLEALLSGEEPLGNDLIFQILKQTAAALDYAHRKGIIHRDVKPANVMLSEDGVVKIADFGVAKITSSSQYTQDGMMLGTPSYMSPEQIEGREVNGRSDQFSLGIVAFEMLTGEKPFAGEHLTTLLFRIVSEDPPQAHRLNPSLSPWIDNVLRRAFHKNPLDRYPCCADFVAELEMACLAQSNWHALRRDGSMSMATVIESNGGHPAPSSIEPDPSAVTQTAVTAPAAVRRPEPPAPNRRKKTRALPYLLAGAASLLFAAGLIFGIPLLLELTRSSADAPAAAAPAVPPPPAPAPNAAGSGRPSPLGVPKAAESTEKSADQTAAGPPALEPVESERPSRAVKAPSESPTRAPAARAVEILQAVSVTTEPQGATVLFDGDPGTGCVSPCSASLPSGRHSVSVAHPGFRSESRVFEVGSQAVPLPIRMEQLTGTVRIDTAPAGASITIDGRIRPEQTPATLKLPNGTHTLVVGKEGYESQQQSFAVQDGSFTRLDFTLTK